MIPGKTLATPRGPILIATRMAVSFSFATVLGSALTTATTLAGEVKNRSESDPAALAGQPLLLWGECGPEEWELIQSALNPVGLSLQPIVQETEITGRTV